MGSIDQPLDVYGSKTTEKKINSAGSKFILNNTSYSGADIKVVVQVYREKMRDYTTEYTKEVSDWMAGIQTEYNKIQEKINNLTHQGTAEEKKLRTKLDALQEKLQYGDAVYDDLPDPSIKLSTTVQTKVLAECQTLSVSVHRPKIAVRAFGKSYSSGFCRGDRQIAGSMIFTVFNENVLYEFLDSHPSDFDGEAYTSAILDQIPPVDIIIVFANEYGYTSRMTIYGAEFVDEGQVMSIEDIITENTVHFVARDLDPMRSVSKRKIDSNSKLTGSTQMLRASNLLTESDYQKIGGKESPYERFVMRRNPFV